MAAAPGFLYPPRFPCAFCHKFVTTLSWYLSRRVTILLAYLEELASWCDPVRRAGDQKPEMGENEGEIQ